MQMFTRVMAIFYESNYEIFFCEEVAITFLINIGRIMDRPCFSDSCDSILDMKLYKDKNYVGDYKISCKKCKNNICVIKYLDLNLPKIKVSTYLHTVYFYLFKLRNWQVMSFIDISTPTYIKLKSMIVKAMMEISKTKSTDKLGGVGKCVQIDETACCRRRLIYSPTSEEAYIRDTVWVIGVYCEDSKRIRLEVLPDRTISTFKNFISRTVKCGTIIKTDGYPSYPNAVSQNNCQHIQVNHSHNFVDEAGNHTNSIESIWAGIKDEIGARHGVGYLKLKDFIKEYELLYELANNSNEREISELFLQIINFI